MYLLLPSCRVTGNHFSVLFSGVNLQVKLHDYCVNIFCTKHFIKKDVLMYQPIPHSSMPRMLFQLTMMGVGLNLAMEKRVFGTTCIQSILRFLSIQTVFALLLTICSKLALSLPVNTFQHTVALTSQNITFYTFCFTIFMVMHFTDVLKLYGIVNYLAFCVHFLQFYFHSSCTYTRAYHYYYELLGQLF